MRSYRFMRQHDHQSLVENKVFRSPSSSTISEAFYESILMAGDVPLVPGNFVSNFFVYSWKSNKTLVSLTLLSSFASFIQADEGLQER